MLHEPVDGVVGIGGVIDGRRVERAAHGAVHHVVAFGSVLAADILHHADVAGIDDHLGGVVVAVEGRAEVRALCVRRETAGAVRSAREQNRRVRGAVRHEDHGVQLRSVAHRDHHVAAHVVKAESARLYRGRRFADERIGARWADLGAGTRSEGRRGNKHSEQPCISPGQEQVSSLRSGRQETGSSRRSPLSGDLAEAATYHDG